MQPAQSTLPPDATGRILERLTGLGQIIPPEADRQALAATGRANSTEERAQRQWAPEVALVAEHRLADHAEQAHLPPAEELGGSVPGRSAQSCRVFRHGRVDNVGKIGRRRGELRRLESGGNVGGQHGNRGGLDLGTRPANAPEKPRRAGDQA